MSDQENHRINFYWFNIEQVQLIAKHNFDSFLGLREARTLAYAVYLQLLSPGGSAAGAQEYFESDEMSLNLNTEEYEALRKLLVVNDINENMNLKTKDAAMQVLGIKRAHV